MTAAMIANVDPMSTPRIAGPAFVSAAEASSELTVSPPPQSRPITMISLVAISSPMVSIRIFWPMRRDPISAIGFPMARAIATANVVRFAFSRVTPVWERTKRGSIR